MPRIKPLANSEVDEKARPLIEGVQKKLGLVPNLMATMANSPAVLEAYLNFSGALGKTSISARLREQIALVVGESNSCDYCVAAHSALGNMAGLSEGEITDSRRGTSPDRKTESVLQFARKLVKERGHVGDEDISALRKVGFGDREISEIVAIVALNIFTNYFNHVAETEVDFPAAAPLENSVACNC